MKLVPLRRRLLYALFSIRFGRRPSYKDVSDKSWQLAPPPKLSLNRKAVYLENQLDRVTDAGTSMEREYQRITGQWQEYRPTTAYLLKSAYLANGYLYKSALKTTLTSDKESLFLSNPYEKIDHAVLTSSYCGNVYFGHFIFDELPLTLAAKKLGKPISTYREKFYHESEYRVLLNLYSHPVSQASFKEIIVIDDVSWNDYKVERIESMRSRLRELIPTKNPKGVYYRRGTSGSSRLLINEAEVENFLAKKGFIILDPQKSSAQEILKESMEAEIIVGVEGSQLAPGLLSVKNEGAILTLQPPNRFNNIYKDRADPLNIIYGFLVGLPIDNGFKINLEELDKTLDLISSEIS
ncbi:MAG: glycosyltransferase family 61 protein [Leptolyngbya sp. SIO1D8]|nr:glycosyltransferase family 61 protein [Leptolyngbya sp. SIO1D8]